MFMTATRAGATAPSPPRATRRVCAPGSGAASRPQATSASATSCAAVPADRNQPSSASDLRLWNAVAVPYIVIP